MTTRSASAARSPAPRSSARSAVRSRPAPDLTARTAGSRSAAGRAKSAAGRAKSAAGRAKSARARSSTAARPTGATTADGRRLRAARNHEAVVSAVLEIVRECPPNTVHLPGAAEVAERAGVSERTVFRHFADLDSLFMAAASKQRPTLEIYFGPRPSDPDVEVRITALVRLRSKLYEEIAPVRRVAIHLSRTHPVVVEQLAQAYAAARAQVADVFAQELSRLDAKRRPVVLDALDLATSWSSWDALRTIQGCSVERARKVVTETMAAVLATVPKIKGR